jgi:hypothetical protein
LEHRQQQKPLHSIRQQARRQGANPCRIKKGVFKMTLVIINTKTNKTTCYYKLFYIKDGVLVPLGFDGLGTDYSEVEQFKKVLSNNTFVYQSKKYNGNGVPVDIIRALKDKFDTYQYIDDFYNGVTAGSTEHFLNEYKYY